MSPLTPYLAAGALAACIGSFVAGGYTGRALCQNGYFKAERKADAQAEDRTRTAQQQDQAAAEKGVVRETIFREITREIPTIVQHDVYRNVCVDDDGVQRIRRAVEAANGGAPVAGPAGDPAGLQPAPRSP